MAYKGSRNPVLAQLGRTAGDIMKVVSIQSDLVTIAIEHHGPVVVSKGQTCQLLLGRHCSTKRLYEALPIACGRVIGLAIKFIVGQSDA